MVTAYQKVNPKYGQQVKFEFDYPEGFILIVDTREQNALFLKKPPKGLVITRDYLLIGDYSVKGFETVIAIERKSKEDFISSITNGRERFEKEIYQLGQYERRWLVIESTEQDLLCWQQYSQVHPNSIRGSLVSIEVRYGVPVHYEPDRRKLERWILDRLVKEYRIKREG